MASCPIFRRAKTSPFVAIVAASLICVESLKLEVAFPRHGSSVHQADVSLLASVEGELPGELPATTLFCWSMTSRFFDETVGGCWPAMDPSAWNGTNVALANRGVFEVNARLVVGNHDDSIIAQARSTFTYSMSPSCHSSLSGRPRVQDSYYEGFSGIPREASPDSDPDPNVNFEFTPLCYNSWDSGVSYNAFRTKNLMVTSSARGMFGSDHTTQQFGHGDRIVLDFVLSKHRYGSNMVELGTFGGVTALYLGMVARIRGGFLDTFDIQDDRGSPVKAAWLDNMRFHEGNANSAAGTGEIAAAAVRGAGLVLVDHADRLDFTVRTVAPNLAQSSVLVVHDFPPEGTTDEVKMSKDELPIHVCFLSFPW